VMAEFARLGVDAERTPYSPLGIRIEGKKRIEDLPPYRDGLVEVQDEGSQLAALMVGAKPGEQIVDYCAGAGGKTLALAAIMGRRGQVYAFDTDAARLERLKPRAKRAEAHNIQPHVLLEKDRWLTAEGDRFHRVLVDVPCSGTGAWRRSPEAPWRLTPEILKAHAERQELILGRAARLVRKGGRLVYVTCSLLPTENEDVVTAFLLSHPKYQVMQASEAWATGPGGAYPGDDPYLNLSPRRQGTDGYFVAVLTRRE